MRTSGLTSMRMCSMEELLGKVPCQVCIMVIVLDTVISVRGDEIGSPSKRGGHEGEGGSV